MNLSEKQSTTLRERINALRGGLNIERFVQDQITSSWIKTVWLLILALLTVLMVRSQFRASSLQQLTTIILLVLWIGTILLVVFNEARHKHSTISLWLKNNLYSTITNAGLTLIITLAIVAGVVAIFNYAVTNASFSAVPPTQIRATYEGREGNSYCFFIGGIDPDVSRTAITRETETRCFQDLRLSTPPAEGAVIGETPGINFCFDVALNDPDNGNFCFTGAESDPAFFEVREQFSGANWGAIWANRTTLALFRFDRTQLWRIQFVLVMLVVLGIVSLFVYRDSFKQRMVRRALTGFWLATPLIFFLLLRGVEETPFRMTSFVYIGGALLLYLGNRAFGQRLSDFQRALPNRQLSNGAYLGLDLLITVGRFVINAALFVLAIYALLGVFNLLFATLSLIKLGGEPALRVLDPDVNWGGLLLTLIISVFAIVVSFPIGLVLALGRRSKIRGVPAWFTYLAAFGIAIWGLINSTPAGLEAARNPFEQVLAFWPLLLPVVAYGFQRAWKGNVLAAFSTIYIEFIRGIPMITVLFLAIVLFPILLPPGVEILSTTRVMWGFTLFAAAYLAENVRGGLQSIPNGQYEAADSLGLSTFDKYRLIILPQAIRVVIPAIVGQFIGLFKDTTLVSIVGLLDLLGVANTLSAQPQWLNVRREAYLALAILYFIGSAIMAGYSRRLERRLGLGER